MDVCSHFILRAAYSRTEDLRRWFLTHECHLFRHRCEKATSSSRGTQFFLSKSGAQFELLSEKEKIKSREFLLSFPDANPATFATTTYFKIPFLQALELVRTRQAYIHKGFAYVPSNKLISIIVARYRMNLSRSLAIAANAFPHMVSESSRMAPLLKNMNQQYIGNDFSSMDGDNDHSLTNQNIDQIANRSMPLCMRQAHKGLKNDHKLKHFARLQYGLFLKGAGMSYEDSLVYFQRMFSLITSDQFQKNYSYNIRHMYGKEGKRANYTPYSCTKIILGAPPRSGEHHGCPFRHYDESNLESLLSSMKISRPDIDQIVSLKQDEHYNLACLKHFESEHPDAMQRGTSLEGVGNHPNQWFKASMSYHSELAGENS